MQSHPLRKSDSVEALHRLWRGIDGLEEMLVYASGYPYADTEWAAEVGERLPAGWQTNVLSANARRLFRLNNTEAAEEDRRVLRTHH